MFGSLWAITKNSFVEVVRRPIYGILLIAGLSLIAFSPVITMFTLMEDVKLVVDMGLGTIFMLGIALAILSATQVISREIEAKTAGAIMSKPVGRFLFVAGKFLGVTLAMALACFIFVLVLLMTVRMGVPSHAGYELDWPVFWAEIGPFGIAVGLGLYANYFYRWNFTSTAVLSALPLYALAFVALCFVSKDWGFEWFAVTFAEKQVGQIARAAVLVCLGVWMISAVAVAASTRVNVVANVVICLGVFFVGMISHFLFGWAVADTALGWMPGPRDETVVISGQVRAPQGAAAAGVRIRGAPGEPVTDESGRYEFTVRSQGSGRITPRKPGYAFSPPSRTYTSVTSHQSAEDYTAIRHEKGLLRYAETAWWGTAWLAYHVVPSLQLLWVADQLMRPEPFIPLSYVGRATLYAGAWCAAMVVFGAFLFERREII